QVERALVVAQRDEVPARVGRLAVRRVALALEGVLAAAEGEAEEVAAQHVQHGRQIGDVLLGPGGDGVGPHRVIAEAKRDRPQVAAALGYEGLDRVRGEAPRRLAEDGAKL